MAPVVPRVATTRLGTVCPATQLRLEAFGRALPEGQTARKLGAVVLVTVTLRIAEETPFAGTPPAPVTWTAMLPPASSLLPAFAWPLPDRVSVILAGVSATSCPDVPLGGAK